MGLLTNFKQNDVFRDEKSLAFDGTNDYVNVDGLSSVFSTDSAFSLVFWFKCLNVGHVGGDDEHKEIIFSAHDSTNSYANILRLGINPNNDSSPIGGIFVVDNSGNTTIYTDNGSADSGTKYFNNGKWHHLVLTNASGAGNTTSNVYIDGVQLTNYYTTSGGSDTNTLDVQWSDADKFSIAQEYDGSAAVSDNFFGNISEVAIYNSALSINQVKTIYNGREPYNHKEGVASGNLKAWYRMGDGSLDDFNLIGDETNATKGNNLTTNGDLSSGDLTGWTHHETYQFDTVEYDSGSIHVVSNGSNEGGNYQSVINTLSTPVLKNKVYEISYDITVNSGSMRINVMNGPVANQIGYSFIHTSSTSVKTTFIANSNADNTTATHGVEIYTPIGTAADINLDNVSLKLVNGNAGVMTNMDIVDIEGDTP